MLGLVLSCCLTPYLMSSMYSIVTAVLDVPGTPGWLWGNLLNEAVESDTAIYMLMAEGPICCVGSMGLLIVILGIVLLVSSLGGSEPGTGEEEPITYEPPPPGGPYGVQYPEAPQYPPGAQYPPGWPSSQYQQAPQQPPYSPGEPGSQYPPGTHQDYQGYPSQPQDPYYQSPPDQYG
jgi:hypothetical protein